MTLYADILQKVHYPAVAWAVMLMQWKTLAKYMFRKKFSLRKTPFCWLVFYSNVNFVIDGQVCWLPTASCSGESKLKIQISPRTWSKRRKDCRVWIGDLWWEKL
jgi:hypothetical protein